MLSIGCLILFATVVFNAVSCSMLSLDISATDLMKGIKAEEVEGKTSDDKFLSAVSDFYFNLFKKTIDDEENSLVSPLSVFLALAMTANGADGNTLEQMEAVLGDGISIDELNEYLYTYINSLKSTEKSKLGVANSIWFRDDEGRFTAKPDFLQRNANYYNAAAYKAPFEDKATLDDINNWVKDKTDGMIDKILDSISEDAVMYLINAVVFDARWETVYNKANIASGKFTSISGEEQTAEFMFSEENKYLEDGRAIGFIKPYADGHYSFVALLPDEDVPIDDYIASLTGESFAATIKGATSTLVSAYLPKFSYDYSVKMNDALKELGMPDAFYGSTADFSRLGESSRGNIFIGKVLHKTFISVDELGTKAGAVTKVEIVDEAYVETKIVRLDRPFVYAIVDNATGLPVFLGTVMNISG